jgi:hypothetical protein
VRITRSLLVLLSFVAACSNENSEDSSQARKIVIYPPPQATTSAQPAATTGNPCEHTGLWSACSLERRLKQSGFVVKKLDDKPKRAGFNVTPVVYSLGSSRLEVFIYEDEEALARDLRAMDTVAVAPHGSTATWPSTPTLIRSANLAAVLLSQNLRQAERVALAITAGPPQPGSPR